MTSEYCKQISSFQGLHSAAVAKKATDFLVLDSHHKQNRAKTKVKLYLPAGISEFIARNEIRIARHRVLKDQPLTHTVSQTSSLTMYIRMCMTYHDTES